MPEKITLRKTIEKFAKHPKRLILLDAIGAFLSAILIGFVLPNCPFDLGIPIRTLYFLAALPCVFVLIDFIFYFRNQSSYIKSLGIIAGMNFSYCLISIALMIYHFTSLTTFALGYFTLEIALVACLAMTELKTAVEIKRIKQ